MESECRALAERLAPHLLALSVQIEDTILAQMLKGEDTFCSYRFDVDVGMICGMVEMLREDARLRTDFREAVEAYRRSTHWQVLLERIYKLGNLQGKLRLLEREVTCYPPEERGRLAEHLNCLDGEIALCQDLADRRQLASRISAGAGYPLIDGLTIRGMTYILGDHLELWRTFQSLIDKFDYSKRISPTIGEA
jgi:hypothetical protein